MKSIKNLEPGECVPRLTRSSAYLLTWIGKGLSLGAHCYRCVRGYSH